MKAGTYFLSFVLAFFLILSSCSEDEKPEQVQIPQQEINQRLESMQVTLAEKVESLEQRIILYIGAGFLLNLVIALLLFSRARQKPPKKAEKQKSAARGGKTAKKTTTKKTSANSPEK